jgi:hypothetical protein
MTDYNPDNYIFFWGGFLSNFYPASFTVDNIAYNCSEQYFMKKKQETFDSSNDYLATNILKETNPKYIKNYGRKVKNFDEKKWSEVRYDIMKKGVYEKFSQNKQLKDLLLNTNDKTLVEASPFDKIWGIGLNEDNAKVTHPCKWTGLNLLGKILMEVRSELKC